MAQGFNKFMGKGDSGAKKKERIRQEKKKVRQETKEYFEKKKQEAREARAQGQAGGFQSERGRKDFKKGNEATRQKSNEATREQGNKNVSGFKSKGEGKTGESFKPKAAGRTPQALGFKPKAAGKTSESFKPKGTNNKQAAVKATSSPTGGGREGALSSRQTASHSSKTISPKPQSGKPKGQENKSEVANTPSTGGGRGEAMPLNKFIAHCGICSRRDAVDLVKSGKVIVNGAKVVEPGHKVSDKDEIKVNGKKLFVRRNLVYILLNKPKDYITTTEDPQGRKTVMDILRNATEERVYPIGRLDRNTTGVLLLTNDGELTQKLSHPSYEIKKIYEVKLDKPLTKKDFETILSGVTLEDGIISPDSMAYADSKDKSVIGIEIHSGRNRIVRRIFEHMGYDVRNLDRVMYANLTKKNVDRGKWRFLTEKEVRLLKYLNASYTKNKNATRG
jgi:23S rRNA pseudouridine2605 synthase